MALSESGWILTVSLSCLLGWAVLCPALGKGKGEAKAKAKAEDSLNFQYLQAPSDVLGQRLLLWLLTLAGFYGLVWILDDFTSEHCFSASEKGVEVMDWYGRSAQARYSTRHGCSMQSSLKSLAQIEQDLVTLLYKLRKHKVALAAGGFSSDQRGLSDLVIYTIQDET